MQNKKYIFAAFQKSFDVMPKENRTYVRQFMIKELLTRF